MTRKKSNVKALALAVTCAILAGGYSGLNPVYAAADTLYKEGNNVTTSSTPSVTGGGTNTEITELTVGGVTIGGTGEDAGQIIAKNIVGIKNASAGTLSDIHINGATFASGGAITANGGLTTNSVNIGGLTISSLASGSTTSATNYIAGIKDSSGAVTAIGISGTKFESNGAITASSLKLNDGIHPINNVAEAIGNNKDNITTLQTKTTNISYNATTGTTVDGVVLKEKGISAAGGKFTVYEDGKTVFKGDATDNGSTTIKAGETVVKGANGTVTINNSGINIAQKEQDTNKDLSITLDSGYVKASGYVQAPKFYIDNNNVFEKEADGTSRLTVSDVGENGEVTKFVRIGGGNILASGDVNVAGSLNTNTIGEATTGTGVTVEDVKFKAGAVSGVKSINDKIKFSDDGTVTSINGGIKISPDGKTVTFNENNPTGQVQISEKGIKVGTGSTYISGDAVYTGNADYDQAKAGMKNDGSLKAAGGAFKVDTAGKVTTTGNIEGQDITANGALKGASLNVTGNATVGGTLDVDGDTTVKGNLAVDKNIKGQSLNIGTTGDEFKVDALGNVAAKGQLTANSATIGTVGITNTGVVTGVSKLTTTDLEVTGLLNISGDITAKDISGDSLTVTGAIKGATLDVTGAVTGATINGATITTNSFNGATIGATTFNGVTLTTDGDVSGRNMTASGTIKGNEITDGAGASMKAGTVTGTKITDGTGFTATGGNVTAKDINATTATIAGVGFAANNVSGINNLTATGTIQGATLKVNDSNLLDSNGLTATKAVIDNLTIDGASITSNNADGSVGVAGITVDKTGAITGVKAIDGVAVAGNTASGLTIGSGATAVTIGGNSMALSSTNFGVDNDGDVTGQSFTAGNSYLKDGELKLNDANIWTTAEGIKAEKAVIGANTLNAAGISTTGTLGVKGQATFGDSTSGNYTTVNGGKVDITANGGTTTIEGAKITTKTLDVEDIILRNEMKDGTGATINIKGSDGSMSVASGKFAVDDKGQVTNHITATGAAAADTIFTTSETGIDATFQKNGEAASSGLKIDHNHAALNASGGAALDLKDKTATLGIGTDSLTTYTSDAIESKVGTDASRTLKADQIVDAVGTDASRTLKATEIVDAVGSTTVTTKSGGTTFGDGTANNTLINGSIITSTNGGTTGVLNGSNLTLTNGANSTALTAGGATFTGTDGRSNATGVKNKTTIDGGIITTDTLNVQRIELGDKLVDKNGTAFGGNLSMDNQGNFLSKVGKTTLQTDTNGARMSYAGTVTDADGHTSNVTSNVSVGNNSANVSAGAGSIDVTNESITSKVTDNASSTITKDSIVDRVGSNSVTTDANGTTFNNGTNKTTINGGTITTNHLITDKLTITGSGNSGDPADTGSPSGSIAFGGNGSITSNIIAGTQEATFKTDETGTFTEAKDGGNKTTNTVNAQGNTNEVTDGTNTSTATQTATSIGGVVTNGTVKMRQELTADGMKVSVDGDTANYTQITNKDVSITDPKNTGERIKLSDLGQLKDLDGELKARDEYKNNEKTKETAVGAINAEAGIRREEVARLDNRIDDVNNRVDKVGAMAAAIASLKSIGYDPQAPSEFSIGLGQYKGETGVAMGFFHYPNKNFMINVSLSTAGGETMGGIGATWRFGHKSPQKLLDEQREAQARKELAAAEKYQAAAKLAKEAQERAEYAAKLARQAQVSADNAKAAADATQAKHFQ